MTRREARALAKKMKARMPRPKNWTIKVWNNLGWHCGIVSGPLKVSPVSSSQPILVFHAFLGDPDSGGGKWVGLGRTPNEAVRDVIHQATEELSVYDQWLEDAVVA